MSRMSHVTTTLNNTNSWPLTIGLPKRKVVSRISKPPFFSGYVSFTEGRWWFEPRFLGSNKQIQLNFMALWSGLGENPIAFPWFLGRRSFTLSEGGGPLPRFHHWGLVIGLARPASSQKHLAGWGADHVMVEGAETNHHLQQGYNVTGISTYIYWIFMFFVYPGLGYVVNCPIKMAWSGLV